MSGKLHGKVAVITGGNSGIGLATAKRFVTEDAYVFITGRLQAELDAAVREIGGSVDAVQGDVAKRADLDELYDVVKRKAGRLDIVFAKAGAAEVAPLGEITEEQFDRIFSINVKAVLFTVQKALPLMPDGGSIILNASITASKGWPAWSIYSATKAALRSFARTWRADLKDRRIRVNAVSPGYTDAPGLNELLGPTAEQSKQTLSIGVPLGRIGTPDEIAKAVVFLAYVQNELHFDAAIDHRAADFPAQLAAAYPDGIDVYFENVGGAIWQAVLPLLNNFARVPVGGLLAQYNGVGPGDATDRLPATMRAILSKSLVLRGFINSEFVEQYYSEFLREVGALVTAGRIHYREDIVDGL